MDKAPSLYSRLFTWRERAQVAPLENFLTEALADILGRLPRSELADAVACLFLPAGVRPAWLGDLKGGAACVWTTQRSLPKGVGTPDLILEVADKAVLVVEVKVDSPIGGRLPLEDVEEGGPDTEPLAAPVEPGLSETLDQLGRYGKWLIGQDAGSESGALALLSRATVTPERLWAAKGRTEDGLRWRHCQWHDVWRWLLTLARARSETDTSSPAGWLLLCDELAKFLEEKEMATEVMTSRDLAAAELLISGTSRISATFSRIADAAKEALSGTAATRPRFHYNAEGGAIEGWVTLRDPANNWDIGWGIRFPSESTWWTKTDPPLPETTHAFAYLYSDWGARPSVARLAGATLPGAWKAIEDGQLVASKCLHEFAADPDQRTADLAAWVGKQVADLIPILPRLRS